MSIPHNKLFEKVSNSPAGATSCSRVFSPAQPRKSVAPILPIEIRNQIAAYERERESSAALVGMMFAGAIGFVLGCGFVFLLQNLTGK